MRIAITVIVSVVMSFQLFGMQDKSDQKITKLIKKKLAVQKLYGPSPCIMSRAVFCGECQKYPLQRIELPKTPFHGSWCPQCDATVYAEQCKRFKVHASPQFSRLITQARNRKKRVAAFKERHECEFTKSSVHDAEYQEIDGRIIGVGRDANTVVLGDVAVQVQCSFENTIKELTVSLNDAQSSVSSTQKRGIPT